MTPGPCGGSAPRGRSRDGSSRRTAAAACSRSPTWRSEPAPAAPRAATPGGTEQLTPRRDRGAGHGQGRCGEPGGQGTAALATPARLSRSAAPRPRGEEPAAGGGRRAGRGGKKGVRPALKPPPPLRFVLPGPAAAAQEKEAEIGEQRAAPARPPQPAMAHSPVAVQVPGMQVSSTPGPKWRRRARARLRKRRLRPAPGGAAAGAPGAAGRPRSGWGEAGLAAWGARAAGREAGAAAR